MNNNFELHLQQYAELAVKVGVNVHPGQTLVVNAPITAAHFVRKIVKAAYETGAKLVKVNWSDETVTRLHYDLAPDEAFSIEPKWFAGEMTELVEEGAAILHVIAENPDLLNGVAQERIVTSQRCAGKHWRNIVPIRWLINSAGLSLRYPPGMGCQSIPGSACGAASG